MNLEEAQRVRGLRLSRHNKDNETISRKRIEITDFLKTHAIFKDMLKDREDLYNQCKEFIYLNEIIPNIKADSGRSLDYIAGFKAGIEYLGKALEEYKTKYKEYENLIGGNH